ncbi:hypothetical protein JK185_02470 [Gluconobacter wancherniae]|uniref:tetratricopeptide repeat protein n=1 Tax=Gluconobacter wancherniae TaxID=1307955 RepID=UPI001B8D8800|nr:tetratricopeptide repeat protein [Gluconobacter wancherniae]MBS1061915.1 hypothetical protein [Gluconobacter wancherniae]
MLLSRSFRNLMMGTAFAVSLTATQVLAQDAPDGGQLTSREAIALQDQIASLRQQVSQVQNAPMPAPSASSGSSSGNSDSSSLTAQLLERVSALEEQNRQMRGELDQLTNSVKENQASVSKQISDMQFAAQNGTAAGSAGAASTPSPAKTENAPAAGTSAQPKTALEALDQGKLALKAGDYTTSESDARFAIKTAHSVPGKMDAQFLLAQSLAGQKQYRESAVAYYDAYNKSPKSAKAQDSLLGVAASLIAMGDKNSACQALDKLKTEFPSPAPRVKAAETTFRGRAACH